MKTVTEIAQEDGPTMFDHWKHVYSKAYWDEHGNIPIELSSVMHKQAHEAGLKAVIVGVAKSVSDAHKFAHEMDLQQATSKVF